MSITADKVVVELEAKDQAYFDRLDRAARQAEAKFGQIAEAANKAGGASSTAFDPAADALERSGKAADAAGKALKGTTSDARAAQQQMQRLARAGQEVGRALAQGRSPLEPLARQLPQIMRYGGQADGVMSSLGATIAGIINPATLAATAISLVATAAISYATRSREEVRSVDQVLKDHTAIIAEIKAAYGDAALAASEYAKGSLNELSVRLQASVNELRVRLRSALNEALRGGEFGYSTRSTQHPFLPTAEFELFREQIARLWREGEPALRYIREEIAALGLENGAEDAAAKLLRILDPLFRLDDQIRIGSEGIDEQAAAWSRLQTAVDSVKSDSARKEIQSLTDKFREGEISLEDLIKALGRLSENAPNLQPHVEEIARLGLAADVTRQKLETMYAPIGGEGVAGGKTGRISNLPDTVSVTPTARVDPYFEDWRKKTRGGGGSRQRDNEYERLTKQIEARTKALSAETSAQALVNPLIDDYGYAAERARNAQQLLTAAKSAGIAAGKELSDIAQLLSEDFDSLSPKAREQAQAMLALADRAAQATSESQKLAEAQRDLQRTAEEFRDFGQDVLGGFIRDLRDGKSAAEALEAALGKVADKLLDIMLTSIFKGFNPFSMFGLKDGGPVKRYAGGGKVRGPGGSRGDKILARLSDGEFVVNAKATAQNRELLEAINSGKINGFADGGFVGAMTSMPSIPSRSVREREGSVYAPVYQIDARGADAAAVARLESGLKERDRKFGAMVDARTDRRNVRRDRG